MKTKHIILVIAISISCCSRIDLSNDENAMSYMIAYQLSKSHFAGKLDYPIIKEAVTKFPEKNSSLYSKPAYRSHYERLKLFAKKKIKINKKAYLKGVKDYQEGKSLGLSSKRVKELKQKYFEKITVNPNISQKEFINLLKQHKKIKITPSGLYYQEIKKTKGDFPTKKSRVTAHMIGRLRNGFEITNSHIKGSPMQFDVNRTIQGMQEGLLMMPKGSHYIFYIPPKLGYGEKNTRLIPGNSFLIYEVELIDINR